MMTLEEARNNIGAGVAYTTDNSPPKYGTIVRVTHLWVLVQYGEGSVKATHPRDLTLLSDPA